MTPCSDEEFFYKLDNLVISSTQYLHQAFKMRWKLEMDEDWKDEPDYVQNFFSQHCKSVLEKAMPFQKKILLSSCSLNDCDISLMSLVLLNFGNAKKYKLQNQAVRQLKDLRNDLAHHNNKKLHKECEIRKLTEEAPVSSSLDTIERVKKLLKNAEQFIILQDYESALKIYSEAIAIPKVLPVNLGEVYEKRAACYLSLTNTQYLDVTHADQAILDVEEALKLNTSSWNAHYLKAKCHKAKNNLPEAIQFYELALALSPVQKKVRQDLYSCRQLNLTQKFNASLNLDQLPMTLSEIVKQMETKSGQKVQYKHYSDSDALNMCPVVVGDGFYYGHGVSPDYAKAIKYYAFADKLGYASGTYSLGLCYYYGHGVEQDMKKSIQIWKRCATMDAKTIAPYEQCTPLGFNKNIALAETDIGKCYEEGTGVDKNLFEAADWYLKGMEHGDGESATLLGCLFYNAMRRKRLAEMCWKQGLIFESAESAALLKNYYINQFEPKMARVMFQIAREMGHSKCLEMSEEEFSRDADVIMSESIRCQLEETERQLENNHLTGCHKGMTIWKRLNCEEHSSNDNTVTVVDRKEYLLSPVRKGLILQHRERLGEAMEASQYYPLIDDEIVPAKLQQTRAKKMADLKPITLQEMNPTKDRIFENRILDLTIIDEPNAYFNSIQLVAEDENGDTTRVYVDSDLTKQLCIQRFEIGCRFAVMNPYMWICVRKNINAIRVNEPKCIMFFEKVKDICGFCGEENAIRKCSKCKLLYCSRECQTFDWELFEHKLICSSIFSRIQNH